MSTKKKTSAATVTSTSARPHSRMRTAQQQVTEASTSIASASAEAMSVTLENSDPFDLDGRVLLAKVLHVIDGDTLILGFILFRKKWQVRCRCTGFNCAEMRSDNAQDRAAALRARDYVVSVIGDKVITATFGHNDKYGRALVNITLPDGKDLCKSMISGGFAAAYDGRSAR